jgi:hypothetical protein
VLNTHEEKAAALHRFYAKLFGAPTPWQSTLNWDAIQPQRHDLHNLDEVITDKEVEAAVRQTPPEKSPGPDGFIDAFYKS